MSWSVSLKVSVQTTTDEPLAELALSESIWMLRVVVLTGEIISGPSDSNCRPSRVSRAGRLRREQGFSLGNYVLLVEYTGRLFREGKAVISGELTGIFERLGSNAENWQARLQKLAAGRLLGRFFAASRARLREVAERLGVHHLPNLGGCATR